MRDLIDTHCHILPGVDDGPGDLDTGVRMAALAAEDCAAIVATPHVIEGVYDGSDVAARVLELGNEIEARGFRLRVYPGAEVAMSVGLTGDAGRLAGLCLADSKYVLIETAEATADLLAQAVYQVRLAGLFPVLAHPERTHFVQADPAPLAEMIEAGDALCQVTAASLTGALGKLPQKTAMRLLRLGAVHLVASDAHSTGRRRPGLTAAYGIVKSAAGEPAARLLMQDNPEAIIAGSDMSRIGPLALAKKGIWARLKRG